MEPRMELVATKGVEIFSEAIPGCVLQIYVALSVLKTSNPSTEAVFSLIISALSTGYSSATVTFDSDTDEISRLDEPFYYGMIPAGGRGTAVFVIMIFNSALLLIIRSTSTALLFMLGSK